MRYVPLFTKILIPLLLLGVALYLFFRWLSYPPNGVIDYGTTFSQVYAEELGLDWQETYLALLDDLQIDHLRLVAHWNKVEVRPGVYNFTDLDWQLREAQKRGVKVVLAIGRKLPRWPECHEPAWWKNQNEAAIQQGLLALLAAEVNHFKDFPAIKYYQVENEPFFPFGDCPVADRQAVADEVDLVRRLDPSREILVSDSGEGGLWVVSYNLGDYLAISMYRKIWFDFWGLLGNRAIYFKYPLPPWTYKIKAALLGIPLDRIWITELQAEPWGPGPIPTLTREELDKTMDEALFADTIAYAQQTGINAIYLWGAEWWYYEKLRGRDFFWEEARSLWN